MQVSTKFNVTGQRKKIKFLSFWMFYHKASRKGNFIIDIKAKHNKVNKKVKFFFLTLPLVFLPNHLNCCLMALREKESLILTSTRSLQPTFLYDSQYYTIIKSYRQKKNL